MHCMQALQHWSLILLLGVLLPGVMVIYTSHSVYSVLWLGLAYLCSAVLFLGVDLDFFAFVLLFIWGPLWFFFFLLL